MGMCCVGEDEGVGVIMKVMGFLWVIIGVTSVECGSISPDGRRRKNGGVSAFFVPCMVVLKNLYCINVGCNSALLVGLCTVFPHFIIEGGRPLSRCDGGCVNGTVQIRWYLLSPGVIHGG